jgi:hypothetical protein
MPRSGVKPGVRTAETAQTRPPAGLFARNIVKS